jgi:hypothetical protein
MHRMRGLQDSRLLLASIDEAYDRRSWHGTNLRGSLRGVTAEQAAWRPADDRHNIWELVVHAAFWKYDIRRRLSGEKGRSFALEGSNFWARPLDGTAAEWKADLLLLQREHDALRRAVDAFPPARWSRKAPGKPFAFEGLVRGVAAHDLYHAGQIQLLKRLSG